MRHRIDQPLRESLAEPWDRRDKQIGADTHHRGLIERPFAHVLDARFIGEQALQLRSRGCIVRRLQTGGAIAPEGTLFGWLPKKPNSA